MDIRTMNTNEISHRALLISQRGQKLCILGNKLKLLTNLNTGISLDLSMVWRVQNAASRLCKMGNWLISLSNSLNRIVDSTIAADKVDEEYIRQTFSELESAEQLVCKVNDYSTGQTGNNYWSKSFEYAIKGDYSNEFTLMGMLGNIGIGLIPYVGQAADVRDLSYAVSHTNEHSLGGNVGLISLSLIAFIPLVGDAIKNLKYLKYADEAGDVVKRVDIVDETVKGLEKNGDEFFNGTQSFKGVLKGVDIDVPNVKMQDITYVKRNVDETKVLRNAFNNSTKKEFLSELGKMDEAVLKNAGLSTDSISQIRVGQVPDLFQIHHKLPLDDSGDNSLSNLILIKNDPYHKVITNYQNDVSRGLTQGNLVDLSWPIPNGMIYTGKK